MNAESQKIFDEKMALVNDAIALRPTSRVPVVPCFNSVMQRLCGSSYRDIYYDFDRAGEAAVEFYKKYPVDANTFAGFRSGRATEISETTLIDWPGRPGTSLSDYSSHQVLEREYMTDEEYPEVIHDYTGYILTKLLPRAYPGLKGLSGIRFNTPTLLSLSPILDTLTSPEACEAYDKLKEIGRLNAEAKAKAAEYQKKIEDLGIPQFYNFGGQAPFDLISDYLRGTMGVFEDQLEREDEIMELCEVFIAREIKTFEMVFKGKSMPVKRVFFPLHKAMDGFMSPKQFETLYWGPLMKLVHALVDLGVTPFLYAEGPYNTRLDQMCDLPKGKCIVHMEKADMKRVKETVGKVACISGNLPVALMEFGKKEEVVKYARNLLETCAPGGGYIFDFDAGLENAKEENMDALMETLEVYGKY